MSISSALQQITDTNVVIVAGKGGVGKTTVTALVARAAAQSGRRVLAVELDGKPALANLLGDSADIPVDLLHIDPGTALRDYLLERGFGRLTKRFLKSGAIDVVSTATPGLGNVVTLGKIKQIERSGTYDLIVVDGPAAGHAITFLTSAAGLLDAVRSGPVHRQAVEVDAMLGDHQRCSTVLVTVPEVTPVNEVIETAFLVEERARVRLSGIVVNQVAAMENLRGWDRLDLPADQLAAVGKAADFASRRAQVHAEQLARLDSELPLPRVELAALPVAGLDAVHLDVLLSEEPAASQPSPNEWPQTSESDALGVTNPLPEIVDTARVIVCCGSGGVGKTTTAATLGLEAAARGRRAVVVTIDPARRLADALGLPGGLSGTPTRITGPDHSDGSHGGGEMWAMMLDTAAMLQTVVSDHAVDDDQAARIAENPFFVNMSERLSGTQEYMASEALYRLADDDRFDVVIVDTPPSRSALEFLESPGVLARFLQHPVFKLMMLPTRTGMKLVNGASQLVLGRIGQIIGSDVLADAAAFFQAFAGMEVGFRERAEAVSQLMVDNGTHFVVVCAPQRDTVMEATWFVDQLQRGGHRVSAVVVNRLLASLAPTTFGAEVGGNVETLAVTHPAFRNLWRHEHVAAAQQHALSPLIEQVGADLIAAVPLQPTDIHDLDALAVMRAELMRVR